VARFTISPAAEDEILSTLAWTHEHFNERARRRYEALLVQDCVNYLASRMLTSLFRIDKALVGHKTE
jgi:plasmid stabilization system protein ParE